MNIKQGSKSCDDQLECNVKYLRIKSSHQISQTKIQQINTGWTQSIIDWTLGIVANLLDGNCWFDSKAFDTNYCTQGSDKSN